MSWFNLSLVGGALDLTNSGLGGWVCQMALKLYQPSLAGVGAGAELGNNNCNKFNKQDAMKKITLPQQQVQNTLHFNTIQKKQVKIIPNLLSSTPLYNSVTFLGKLSSPASQVPVKIFSFIEKFYYSYLQPLFQQLCIIEYLMIHVSILSKEF